MSRSDIVKQTPPSALAEIMKKNTGGQRYELPADLRGAIESSAAAKTAWKGITPLARNEWICWVISAKKIETRKRRMERAVEELKERKRRPCCWAGCPHR